MLLTTATPATYAATKCFSLLFTTHNNGVKRDSIGHNSIGHTKACVVASIRHCVSHLPKNGAYGQTHLSAVYNGKSCSTIRSSKIMAALRIITTIMGTQVVVAPEDLSYLLMCSGGAMALIIA